MNNNHKFQKLFEYINFYSQRIEEFLKNYLKEKGFGKRVIEAALYSFLSGGKRIRPVLCFASFELFSGNSGEKILPFGVGIECLHTYSLIHDDLPCMDDDDLRRGKPTCHKAFDEATAILAGDGLQALAFELFTHPFVTREVRKTRIIKAIHLMAKAVGFYGMVGGQMADLLMEGKKGNLRILNWIHRKKTMELIKASIVSGALLGGAKAFHLKNMEIFGKYLGLLFQIKDDILDLTGDEKKIGKPVKSDLKKKKLTYPALKGLEESQRIAQTYYQKALSTLSSFPGNTEILELITHFVWERDY